MSLKSHHLELLSPARDISIGKEAILHGADAVYIGGPSFGARMKAENSVADIAELVQFAQRFHAKIFVTLNTILHESELEIARDLIHQYWNAGVDALIVQDMGILKMDIPPIALHASTQCDIRTVEKAAFLGDVGFSQLVLAREMTLDDIRQTRAAVNPNVPLEFFVHGALCVAFSGNCSISHAHTGRSANRGECAQECRLPYTLKDKDGAVVAFDKHLLSMKDNDQSVNIGALIEAGIRSFKIEGRYKDVRYVKNVTAHYRQLIDEVLTERTDLARCSIGESVTTFAPQVEKTFNRSSTDYFVNGRKDDIGAFDAATHMGEPLGVVRRVLPNGIEVDTPYAVANGDGLTYMNKREVRGMAVNGVKEIAPKVLLLTANVPTAQLPGLAVGTQIYRNRDHVWDSVLMKPSATRKIPVVTRVIATHDGAMQLRLCARVGAHEIEGMATLTATDAPVAQSPEKLKAQFESAIKKVGTTDFSVDHIAWPETPLPFVPSSALNQWRREAVESLAAKLLKHAQDTRAQKIAPKVPSAQFPSESVSFLANVYNPLARAFYSEHGVKVIAAAYESHEEPGDVPLMVTKHCLRWSFNLCPKQAKGVTGVQGQVRAEPMTLESAGETLTLVFDCKPCEMHVVGKMKSKIFKSPSPAISPLTFFAKRPEAMIS